MRDQGYLKGYPQRSRGIPMRSNQIKSITDENNLIRTLQILNKKVYIKDM